MSPALILLILTLAALGVAGARAYGRFKPLFNGVPSHRTEASAERLGFAIHEVGLHRRLLKFRLSGVIHMLVFFSFLVLLTAILQSYFKTWLPGFEGSSFFAILQDVGGVLMLVGVSLALYNRLVIRPERFEGSNKIDAYITLALITAIVVAMLMEFAFHIVATGANTPFHPVAGTIAQFFSGLPSETAVTLEAFFYWLHICTILGFLIYLPGSKHLHMFAGLPNIYFRNRDHRGKLGTAQGKLVPPGQITEMPWKGMLDLYSCTECGRCQSVCPAYSAGLPLSPKTLIMDMRDHLVEVATTGVESADKPLAGGVISADTLWACTSCQACMQVCPLHIEHVPKIVDLRRLLVDEGEVSKLTQATLQNFQQYGNSFKKPPRARPKWTHELAFKIPNAQEEEVDFLWYVGDYASYHPLVQKQTCNIATLLHNAGVSFGILYDQEKNSGNDVRRMGEEGLFQDLAEENIAAIKAAKFKKIFTTDPHTLNTLSNEYADFGLDVDVLHYTQLFHELMLDGTLSYNAEGDAKRVTFHDPCYLGRYNGKYEAPRDVIKKLGYDLLEMPRNRENSFCCGAGGGRIFMEDESTKERPSESRIKEALALGDITHFVVTCPKDVVMYTAAVENLGVQEQISVREISELFNPQVQEGDRDEHA